MIGRQSGGWLGFGGNGQFVVQVVLVGLGPGDEVGAARACGVIVTGFGFASARAPSHKAAKREKKRTVRMLRIR